MKKLILLVAALAACAPAEAASLSRAAGALNENGFKDCVGALDFAVKIVHQDDAAYSFLDIWSPSAPNKAIGGAMTIRQYSDGASVQTFAAVKNAGGSCDVTTTGVFPILDQTCAALQKEDFKDWKRREDMPGVELYQAPNGALMHMNPLGLNGCLLVQNAVYYDVAP